MISAAFPRFAPRFSFDALRGRDRRWAAHSGLFLAILLAGIVDGQITRGDRGITPTNSSGDFLASGILVDVTGDNADDARSKGWREAQRSAELTSDLQSLMRISYAVFCLKTKQSAVN